MDTRKIKFRSYHNKSKEWWTHEQTLSVLMLRGRVIDGTADDKGYLDNIVVEQFTGLKDKNDKDIYEGDILKCTLDQLHLVEFGIHDECPAFILKPVDKTRVGSPFIINLKSFEVVGNIHENPELLKE